MAEAATHKEGFPSERTFPSLARLKTSGWKIALGITVVLLVAWIGIISVNAVYRWQVSKQAWKLAQSDLEAKGESLTIDEFLPEPIPDSENFFADPIWMEMTDRGVKEKNGITRHVSRLPEEKRQLEVLENPLSAKRRAALEKEFPEFAPIEGKKSPAQAALKVWREAKGKEPQERRRAADLILVMLEESGPMITQLRNLGQRPDALYPLNYEDGFHMALEHISYLLVAGQWLEVHALASLEIQQTPTAEQDILAILRLSRTLAREPATISKLVQGSLVEMAISVVNRGIKTHAWDKPQLVTFRKELESINLLPPFTQALRFERASFNESVVRLLQNGRGNAISEVAGTIESKSMSPLVHWTFRWLFLGHDKVFYNNAIQEWVEALESAPKQGVSSEQIRDIAQDLGSTPEEKAKRLFSALSLPDLYKSISRIVFLQSQVDQARVACALELHRIESGAYPDTLSNFGTGVYIEIPPDLTTLKELGYQKKSDAEFSLWSAGWNATDERGKIAKDKLDGDWVWSGEQK